MSLSFADKPLIREIYGHGSFGMICFGIDADFGIAQRSRTILTGAATDQSLRCIPVEINYK
jgi:hypothetical protein